MKNRINAAICAVLALSVGAFSGCVVNDNQPSGGTAKEMINFYSMGTTGTLVAMLSEEDKASVALSDRNARFDALSDEVGALLSGIESSISSSVTTSCVYRYNMAQPDSWTEVDKLTYDLLTTAINMYTITGGSYNPAVWYSVDLYGFTTRAEGTPAQEYDREIAEAEDGTRYLPLPDPEYVTAFQQLSQSFKDVRLKQEEGKYYAYKPAATVTVYGIPYSLRLDLGGIGKGYAADGVYALMQEYGYPYGYFNFGSSSISVKAYANNEDGQYSLSTRDPRKSLGETFCTFKIRDISLSTSGDYEQYYTVDGKRYCHIIDPATGSPIQTGIASVTVIGGSAAEDDALTTAISAMGKDAAVKFINDNPQFFAGRTVVFLVFEGDNGKVITNAPDKIQITNDDYVLANGIQDGKIVLK